jgi:hypothetical protein
MAVGFMAKLVDTFILFKLVAPISDPTLLQDIARARNLSQSVDQTGNRFPAAAWQASPY